MMTPEREKQIRERWRLKEFKTKEIYPEAPEWCSIIGVKLTPVEGLIYGRQDVDILLEEIDRLRVENERLANVPIKWNEDCYLQGYDAAKKEDQTQVTGYCARCEEREKP